MIQTMYLIVGLVLLYSYRRDRAKTKKAFRVAMKMAGNMLPSIIAVVGIVGLIVGLLPAELIARYIGPDTGLGGTTIAALAGAITLIPSLVSFPLAASLLRLGASTMTIAAFITTLTMVGFVTAPLEAKILGVRFTLWRNGLGFISALLIASVMGVILT